MCSIRRRAWPLVLLVLALGVAAGCKGEVKRYRVTGTVKFKGDPIKSGGITFRSLDGLYTGAGNIVNGEYDIPEASGLPVGKYQVSVSYPDPKSPAAAPEPSGMPGDSSAVPKDLLPAKYNSKTELTAEVKAEPRNEVNFDLK